jgi:putative membrane protein
MKTLILCVDRDDDLGAKAGVATPLIGRRRNLDGAVALGLADPEDSDTNALLAAIHLYDQELAAAERGGNPVEVATVAGHRSLGLKADRKLAQELEEVLGAVRPDQVILVSDGAEDEQILPLLHSRAKIVHVHRSVVKQAPRLEGFYYVITRLLDDEKQAKRFVLPLAIIVIVWGLAVIFGWQSYAWGATLAVAGFWLLVHAMKWEARVSRFLADLGKGVRSGWLALFATLLMIVILVFGAVQAFRSERAYTHLPPVGAVITHPQWWGAMVFVRDFWLYAVSGLLVRSAGGLFDGLARTGRAGMGHVFAAFTLIALGFLGSVGADLAVGLLEHRDVIDMLDFTHAFELVAGLAVAFGLFLVRRYVRSFQAPVAR